MKRINQVLSYEWHVAINRHNEACWHHGINFSQTNFMYEAKKMADEVPRMAKLFKAEREQSLPKTHQQCSFQAPVPVKDNHLTCCLGTKTKECIHLLALENIDKVSSEEIDMAKAWTCAAHIVRSGGDVANEGYLLRVDDRMFWDTVYQHLSGEAKEER